MSAEAITDAIQEYLYEKLNDAPETEKQEKFATSEKRRHNPRRNQRHIDKNQRK